MYVYYHTVRHRLRDCATHHNMGMVIANVPHKVESSCLVHNDSRTRCITTNHCTQEREREREGERDKQYHSMSTRCVTPYHNTVHLTTVSFNANRWLHRTVAHNAMTLASCSGPAVPGRTRWNPWTACDARNTVRHYMGLTHRKPACWRFSSIIHNHAR